MPKKKRHGLGRVHAPDERDKNYPMQLPRVAPGLTYKYWWDNGAWLDQGSTGTCVGHGWAHEIEDSPVTHPKETVDPFAIYDLATEIDEWPDNDDDRNSGTSVRAGARAARQKGYIGEFLWAQVTDNPLQTIVNALLTKGPVVVGTNWYDGMFEPFELNGSMYVSITGEVAGGHCYVLNGVNTTEKYFRLKNSWGRSWGDGGRVRISFGDMERLIAEDGEACLPTDVKTS